MTKSLILPFSVLVSLAFAGPATAAPAVRAGEKPPPTTAAVTGTGSDDTTVRIKNGHAIIIAPTGSSVSLDGDNIVIDVQNGHAIIIAPTGASRLDTGATSKPAPTGPASKNQ
ncbi:hypothetical protein Ait01nite_058810 [Actinoplanes italicus]|uniref:Uncharacterized protein n=1 Tax=Actinoplanes italicus TaxID=113567 RepID=A0A2T0K638_9ACTN|nr:hypothetical protein [Actinoplanes italicus]PRX18425.1 hypothetical protein CLV67_113262 [Actinoplanes italicus]GIE32836.1 hypothetical protein Ait01nite_058810 [Actinoplanes italicus]